MKETDLHKIIDRLLKLPKECEWAEFKLNFHSEDEIGKYISALSNGACLQNESYGYLVFGIENNKLQPVGTTFRPTMYKVVANVELFQLPAYDVHIQEKHTKVILYAYQKFANMDKQDRIRACYQHACLKYVMNEKMTNSSLRERFKIADENAAMVSRIIKDTLQTGLIKEEDPENTSRKFVKYIPKWA